MQLLFGITHLFFSPDVFVHPFVQFPNAAIVDAFLQQRRIVEAAALQYQAGSQQDLTVHLVYARYDLNEGDEEVVGVSDNVSVVHKLQHDHRMCHQGDGCLQDLVGLVAAGMLKKALIV